MTSANHITFLVLHERDWLASALRYLHKAIWFACVGLEKFKSFQLLPWAMRDGPTIQFGNAWRHSIQSKREALMSASRVTGKIFAWQGQLPLDLPPLCAPATLPVTAECACLATRHRYWTGGATLGCCALHYGFKERIKHKIMPQISVELHGLFVYVYQLECKQWEMLWQASVLRAPYGFKENNSLPKVR